jgi:sugar-specific transcriptional regulator TrmB
MTNLKNQYLESALKAGLSGKVAAVYVTLLERGMPMTPKALINTSGLHRQYVYDALEELRLRGLVTSDGARKKILYKATSPDRLLQDAEKRRLDTGEAVVDLMRLYEQSPAGVVEIIRGSVAVIKDEFEELSKAKDGDFLYIVEGAGMRWVELYGERVTEWEKIRKQKKIELKYIGSGDDVTYNKERSVIEHESRLIPGIGDIVNVTIRPQSVSFNFYVPEVMTVRVKNKDAVQGQLALFEVLWKSAT